MGSAIPLLIERAKELPIIAKGLDTPYSPNHGSQTTERHTDRQLQMTGKLGVVASLIDQNPHAQEVRRELDAIGFVIDWNYDSLFGMIENPAVKDKPFLYTTKKDLQEYFDPLLEGLTPRDLRVLVAVAALHDIGKVTPCWAAEHLDASGIDFLAHDYDSHTLILDNPELTDLFELHQNELDLALDLIKYHSLPGQYFFGEGNLAGYASIFEKAYAQGSENPIKLARIHGTIDVMSALNHRFVKPILTSQVKLSKTLSDVYRAKGNLADAFEQEAEAGTQGWSEQALDPVSLYRLLKLTGTKLDEKETVEQALSDLQPSVRSEFSMATCGPRTWYGTYVANGFGSGLRKAGIPTYDVIQTLVKAVSGASRFHSLLGMTSYALSSLQPSLMAVAGDAEMIVEPLKPLEHLKDVFDYLKKPTGLHVHGNINTVEITYIPEQ